MPCASYFILIASKLLTVLTEFLGLIGCTGEGVLKFRFEPETEDYSSAHIGLFPPPLLRRESWHSLKQPDSSFRNSVSYKSLDIRSFSHAIVTCFLMGLFGSSLSNLAMILESILRLDC
ncbi:uncharacterized protein VP01_2237g2 [Puccinia sorghi]|uniref:Uncharacterized protein n=1 Tax=Puccinia sorghi TaxID=27349 RepID=A0A0L6VAG6_9BASI|nr:uncharacterized protein VP01_2237g2 [Puccinia sorghi]